MITEDTKILQDGEIQKRILSTLNSYLGLIQHFDTFTIRKKLLFELNAQVWNYFYISEKYRLIVAKTRERDYGDI